MNTIRWVGGHIEVEPPKKPKKITGTRFAAIMGLNKWTTPFATWCAITKTYEEPFEDTIYTVAGKTIEPKQAQYMKESYGMDNLITPTDVYGEDYFKKTYGDFFRDKPILGGMWDYLLVDEDGKPTTVLEMKTTKRAEDWGRDVPEYYAQQAALYAYLLGVDEVIMVCSFLGKSDYEHPEHFVPSVKNTITVEFRVSERYPDFGERVDAALRWWNEYVLTGVSPDYDEKADADILKELRKASFNPTTDVQALVEEAELLEAKLNANKVIIADDEARLKQLKDMLKQAMMESFTDGDEEAVMTGNHFTWTLSKSTTTKIDETAMKKDGILDRYKTKQSTTWTLRVKERDNG